MGMFWNCNYLKTKSPDAVCSCGGNYIPGRGHFLFSFRKPPFASLLGIRKGRNEKECLANLFHSHPSFACCFNISNSSSTGLGLSLRHIGLISPMYALCPSVMCIVGGSPLVMLKMWSSFTRNDLCARTRKGNSFSHSINGFKKL